MRFLLDDFVLEIIFGKLICEDCEGVIGYNWKFFG